MKCLLILVTLGVAAWAAPDVSHLLGSSGFHHQQFDSPTSSFLPQKGYLPGNIVYEASGTETGPIKHQKHFFYYSIPDEVSATRLRVHILPSNTKNTNVVFVKAPSSGPVVPEIITSPHHAEEKTKVYVLVKNQDRPSGTIKVPLPVTVKSRPEVYVVKYDNDHEAQHIIANYQQGGQTGGVHVENLGDENRFISAIQAELNKIQINQQVGPDGYIYGRSGRANTGDENNDSTVAVLSGRSSVESVESGTSSVEGTEGHSFGYAVNEDTGSSSTEGTFEFGNQDKSHIIGSLNVEGDGAVSGISVNEASISGVTNTDF